jgi:hypothetical protein
MTHPHLRIDRPPRPPYLNVGLRWTSLRRGKSWTYPFPLNIDEGSDQGGESVFVVYVLKQLKPALSIGYMSPSDFVANWRSYGKIQTLWKFPSTSGVVPLSSPRPRRLDGATRGQQQDAEISLRLHDSCAVEWKAHCYKCGLEFQEALPSW